MSVNRCTNVHPAAELIGVTFDIRKGYNLEGYRNQAVKLWCSQKKNTKTDKRTDPAGMNYDIPDFMSVSGRYTARMSTKGLRF